MKHRGTRRKRSFLKVELVILMCLACFWAVKSATVDIDGAKARHMRQLDTTDSEAFAHLLAGNVYYDSNQAEEAIDSYKTVIQLDPNCFDAHLNLGEVCYGLARYTEAIECFKEAVRIRPDSTWARTCLGLTYSDWGRCDDAVEVYRQIIKHDPDVADVTHVLIGNAYTVSGRYEEATDAYGRTIEIDADIAAAHYGLARVYLKTGNKALALEEYEILKTLDKELAGSFLNLLNNKLNCLYLHPVVVEEKGENE